MAYSLTLSRYDIRAFDFVGHRYGNGDKMLDLIKGDNDFDFEDKSIKEFTFQIPEHKAWEIKELAEEDNFFFPLFSDKLAEKMSIFIDGIV